MKTKLIGLYELITGVFGFIINLYTMIVNFSAVLNSVSAFFSFLLALILFGGMTYAGYALLNNLKGGHKYSVWAQTLQVVGFSFGGIQYLFTSSAFLYISLLSGLQIGYSFQPIDYGIFRVSEVAPGFLHIYILPIVFLVLLLTGKK